MEHTECDLEELWRILTVSPGEREISKFLKLHPRVLYWTLCPASGHDRFVFSEFPLGSEYKCDFVVLNSYSGAWEAKFIELEPVDDPVILKRGQLSGRMVSAVKQIDDWREYVDRNLDALRTEFVRWAAKFDLLGYCDGENPSNESGDYLADPRTVILDSYHIIAGRSSQMTKPQRAATGKIPRGHSYNFMTYDRILHLARNRYGLDQNPDRWLGERPL